MTLITGDCVEVMAAMPEASVDAIVTDPPYGLEFMGKEWDRLWNRDGGKPWAASPKRGVHGQHPFCEPRPRYGTDSATMQEWHHRWATEALRVAKPGAYLLAFGGTRTVHRLACAIEDAGWIIRDTLVWAYASGFPKSRALLKPAWEPIVMARKPGPLRELAIDACRIGMAPDDLAAYETKQRSFAGAENTEGYGGFIPHTMPHERMVSGRWPSNLILTATEWYTLRDDVDQSARDLITAYFEAQGVGLDGLPGLRQAVRGYASVGTGRPAEVLLPSVQLEGIFGGQAGGDEALPGVAPADQREPDGQGDGAGLTRLEGRSVLRPERLPVGGGLDADWSGAGVGRGDGPEAREGSSIRSGAPAGHGDDAGPPAGESRGHPSPQRGQGRQLPEQPVPQGPVEPHPGASDGGPRTRPTARARGRAGSRERGVTVPRDLIPEGWLPYFEFSHETGIFDGGWDGVVGGGKSDGAAAPASGPTQTGPHQGVAMGRFNGMDRDPAFYGDAGTYSRFFVLPKAARSEREPGMPSDLEATSDSDGSPVRNARCRTCGRVKFAAADARCSCAAPEWVPSSTRRNTHPTVKPLDLMRHLVRLVTPTGGTCLDPFAGSGSTLIAAEMEGFAWLGIERELEYVRISEARLAGVQRGLGLDVAAPSPTGLGKQRGNRDENGNPTLGSRRRANEFVWRSYQPDDDEPAA